MKKNLLLPIIAALVLAAAVYAYEWQEPLWPPLEGNVSVPLNVSEIGQIKQGGLILNTDGAEIGLIIDQGNVGIGTDDPGERKLKVSGDIEATTYYGDGSNLTGLAAAIPSGMIAMFAEGCPLGWSRFAELDGKFARGAEAYGAAGGAETHSHSYCDSGIMMGAGWIGVDYAIGDTYCGGESLSSGVLSQTYSVAQGGKSRITESANNLPPYLDVVWCKKD